MSATLALTLSVVMHVCWNLMARHLPRDAYPLWWVLLAHLLLIAPFGLVEFIRHADWSVTLFLLLALSAGANAVYFVGLARAYELAPVALVYPLVRSSPLLIAIWGTLLFNQSLTLVAWCAIGVSIIGLGVLASVSSAHADSRGIRWALLAMLATSVYSLSDKAATVHISSFAGLIGFLSVGYLVAWLALTWRLLRRTGHWLPAQTIGWPAFVIGGSCIGLAYALVIHAMRTLPAAEVVSYTNAGIVMATLLSVFHFGERSHWRRRLVGTLIITAGLGLLATG